jgi:hypothetical protein
VTNEGATVVVVVDVVVVVVTAVVVVEVVVVDVDEEVGGSVVDVETAAAVVGVDELVRASDEHPKMTCDATSNTGHHDRGVTATMRSA